MTFSYLTCRIRNRLSKTLVKELENRLKKRKTLRKKIKEGRGILREANIMMPNQVNKPYTNFKNHSRFTAALSILLQLSNQLSAPLLAILCCLKKGFIKLTSRVP
jgi:hypothetical protein